MAIGSLAFGTIFFCILKFCFYFFLLDAACLNCYHYIYTVYNHLKEGILLPKQKSFSAILVLSIGALIGAMNITMFNVAMPMMMTHFNASVSTVQWLSSGYLLATGIITPAAGYLGDRFGYNRVFNLTTLFVLLLSVAGTFSWCIESLIVVRFLFGLTAGLLAPLTMAMLYQAVPPAQQTQAVSFWGMATMLGGAMPPCISGAILNYADWRFLLLINVPLALLALALSLRSLPKSSINKEAKLDVSGLALTSAGSLILLIAFSNLASLGFSPLFFVVAAVGAACLILYVVKSLKRHDALLNLSILKYPRYTAAFIADGITIIAMYMVTFVMPLFLQNALNLSPMVTGTIMLPGALCTIIAMPLAGVINTKLGERILAVTGVLCLVIGAVPFLHMTPAIPIVLVVVGMCVRSVGIGFMNLLTTNTQMSAVPQSLSGHASALTNWMRQMVGALITSIASNIVGLRLARAGAVTAEQTAGAYTATTSFLMTISVILTLLILPIALKYFRGRKTLKTQTEVQ